MFDYLVDDSLACGVFGCWPLKAIRIFHLSLKGKLRSCSSSGLRVINVGQDNQDLSSFKMRRGLHKLWKSLSGGSSELPNPPFVTMEETGPQVQSSCNGTSCRACFCITNKHLRIVKVAKRGQERLLWKTRTWVEISGVHKP